MKDVSHFVPDWVANAATREGDPLTQATEERFPAVVLMCDVSGFTALGESLATQGDEGAELLWRTVNGYFGQMLGLIRSHGGDVLRFAGDAPIALWRATDETLAEVTLRVAACGLELQEQLGAWKAPEGATLRIRAALAVGPVVAARVGGVGARWEHIVGGSPFEDIAPAVNEAENGQLLASPEAWAAMVGGVSGGQTKGGNWRVDSVRASPPEPLEPSIPANGAAKAVVPFLPRAVVQRVRAGQGSWLGDLRMVSVVFVGIEGVDYVADSALSVLNGIARTALTEIDRYDGSLNQFLVDDKGTVLLAAWGLPASTHADDAARAVLAARAIGKGLRDQGLTVKIGVATGRVFCGPKGDSHRSEYGLLGAHVNLAARLMQRSDGRAVCAPETRRAADGRIPFEVAGDWRLKGRETSVRGWYPADEPSTDTASFRRLVGRQAELDALVRRSEELTLSRGGLVVVEGEAGIGKSMLLSAFASQVRRKNVVLHRGQADSIEQRTPYHAWQEVFQGVVGTAGMPTNDRVEVAKSFLSQEPEWLRLMPLFNAVLDLDVPENDDTAALDAEGRSNLTVEAYAQVLASLSGAVVVLDDVHWMDSASWELLRRAVQRMPDTLFVLGSRPLDPAAADRRPIPIESIDEVFELGPLPEAELGLLIATRLGVDEVDERVLKVVQERSEGHPFFAEEIALVLRDRGVLEFDRRRCGVAASAGSLTDIELPATLEALIAGRLDQLGPTEQLSLKTAAVVGRSFAFEMVHDIFPIDDERDAVRAALDHATGLDLARIESPEPNLGYVFKHAVTREVAYGQLLFQQRRELHAAAARWIEERSEAGQRPWPVLAYHWQRAEVRDKAIESLEAAGEQAFASFAPREAIQFLTAARELDDAGSKSSDKRRARWERVLGEANARIGKLGEADEHLSAALLHMGAPVPSSTFAVGLAFMVECVRQIWRRYVGPPKPITEGREARIETANVWAELGLNAYFGGDLLMLLYGTIRALNLVETAGVSPDLARLKAGFAIVVSGIPLHGAARNYSLEALEHAGQFDDVNSIANAQHYRGALLCGLGEWDDAMPLLDKAVAGYARCGNMRRHDEAVQCVAHTEMNRGRYELAAVAMETLRASAARRDDAQGVQWAEAVHVELLWRQGRLPEAVARAASVDPSGVGDEIYLQRVAGLKVHLALANGDLALARREAEPLMGLDRPASFVQLWAYDAVAQLELQSWREGQSERRKPALKAVKMLETFASGFPLGASYAALARGLAHEIDGSTAKAKASYGSAGETARRQNMPLEASRADEALARLS